MSRAGVNTASVAPFSRHMPWHVSGRLWILVLLVALVSGKPATADEDDARWSLPEAEQTAVRWDAISGYWADDQGDEFVFTRREGILQAKRWKDGEVTTMAGRWRLIRRLHPYEALEVIAVVTDEQWCFPSLPPSLMGEKHNLYREVSIWQKGENEYLKADLATRIDPPADAMTADVGPMVQALKKYSQHGVTKDEGPWRRVRAEDVPQWFRDLIAQDLIAQPRCIP